MIVVVTLFYGVKAMCTGIVVYNIIEMIVTIGLLKTILPVSFRDVTKNIMPSLLYSSGMAFVTYFFILLLESMLAKLFIGAFVAIISYITISFVFKSQDLSDIIKILKIKKV